MPSAVLVPSRLVVCLLLAALGSACQCVDLSGATFLCNPDGSCAGGLTCGPEGLCVLPDGGAGGAGGGQGGAGGGQGGGGGGSDVELTFAPVEDAFVRADSPDANLGSEPLLSVDADSEKASLLKFSIAGVAGRSVVAVRLVLRCEGSSASGGTVHVTSSGWSESTVTWNNAPPAGLALGSLGSVSSGKIYELWLPGAIPGDGTYSFKLTSADTDGADYASRESGNPPQLIVTVR